MPLRDLQNNDDKFRDLGTPNRVFAVGAIMGDAERLRMLHDHLLDAFVPGDHLVYLGDYIGPHGGLDAVEEMLLFRRMLMMKPGVEARDFTYLRGLAEESWQRLLRLPFAREPKHMLERLLDEGADHYLTAYGLDHRSGTHAARAGLPALTRWTHQLRVAQRRQPGHEPLAMSMRRAAFTRGNAGTNKLLFVPMGFDPSKSLAEQRDALWSGISGFGRITGPVQGFARVIRGRDAAALGLRADPAALTLDPMDGRGSILCAMILPDGHVADVLQVQPFPQTGTAEPDRHGEATPWATRAAV